MIHTVDMTILYNEMYLMYSISMPFCIFFAGLLVPMHRLGGHCLNANSIAVATKSSTFHLELIFRLSIPAVISVDCDFQLLSSSFGFSVELLVDSNWPKSVQRYATWMENLVPTEFWTHAIPPIPKLLLKTSNIRWCVAGSKQPWDMPLDGIHHADVPTETSPYLSRCFPMMSPCNLAGDRKTQGTRNWWRLALPAESPSRAVPSVSIACDKQTVI